MGTPSDQRQRARSGGVLALERPKGPDERPVPSGVVRASLARAVGVALGLRQTLPATWLKMPDRLPPRRATATMMTMAIRATISPYSTAVAPRSDIVVRNFAMCLAMFSSFQLNWS